VSAARAAPPRQEEPAMPTPTNGNDILRYGAAGDAINALAGNDRVNAGGGDDVVHGNAGNDKLFGEAGNDQLWGDAGNDGIDGGAGTDSAHFGGNQSQYQITTSGGVTEVKDLRGQRPDGVDQLTNVERLVFADGTRSLVANAGPAAPTLPGGATVTENAPGAVVGALAASDPDGDPLVWTVDDARFEVALSGGVPTLKLTAATSLDHEAEPTVTVTVTVTDAPPAAVGGAVPSQSASASFTIAVANANEAPEFIGADSFSFTLAENTAAGAVVGTTPALDPDAGDAALVYAIVEHADADTTNNVPFAIDANGRITATEALDFEAAARHLFTIRASDGGGLSDTAQVTVDVADMPEGPPLDLVTANAAFGVGVSVRLGDGEGGFSGSIEVAVGGGPGSVALGDLDGAGGLTPSGLPDLGPLVPIPADLSPI
jgi:Cadherin domain/RTX calcium-binding nonapeptide repeat (4 copies)